MKRLLNIKYIVVFILSLSGLITLQNCERDDICAETTATTPRLLIEFYDVTSPDDLKSVLRFTAYGEDLFIDENGVLIPPTTSSDSTLLFNENENAVELPLIIDSENETVSVRFVLEKFTNFRLDDEETTDSNVDIIEINYIPEFVYVSRACGYKSIFTNLDIDIEDPDGDQWISNIDIEETTIENENTVHVRIYH